MLLLQRIPRDTGAAAFVQHQLLQDRALQLAISQSLQDHYDPSLAHETLKNSGAAPGAAARNGTRPAAAAPTDDATQLLLIELVSGQAASSLMCRRHCLFAK
jgi:hypothetical protein